MSTTLHTGTNDEGRRLDRILRKALPELPLSALHRLLRQGRVLVDGKRALPADRIRAGALISLPDPAGKGDKPFHGEPVSTASLPPILYKGSGLFVLNKPPGLAVHGPDSLDSLVRSYLAPQLSHSLSFRPGPLHRLDKPTSGIIVFSSSLEGARFFSAFLREGRIRKYYLALVEGRPEEEESWEDSLVRDKEARKTFAWEGGKAAFTRIRSLASSGGRSLILAQIGTGRTHQIRAQAALHGYPLAGDRKYGGAFQQGGFLLHAWKLDFGDACSAFPCITAPLPEAFFRRIVDLFGTIPPELETLGQV